MARAATESQALVYTTFKLVLALIMVVLGAVTMGGGSTAHYEKGIEKEEDAGKRKDMFEALQFMGWWQIKKTLDIGYVGSTHHVTVGLGLDGYCARYEQDYDGYDGKYYASRDWSDGDTDLGKSLDEHCDDQEGIPGYDKLHDRTKDAINAMCSCRASGTALKVFAITMLVLLSIMIVLDVVRIITILDDGADKVSCVADSVSCMTTMFYAQLTLSTISFVCTLVALGVATAGCPVYADQAAAGFISVVLSWQSNAIDEDDLDSVTYYPAGGMVMFMVVFFLHIVYLKLAFLTPKMRASAALPRPAAVPRPAAQQRQQGVAAQSPQVQASDAVELAFGGTGAKFDAYTGQPIPKFDPATGRQNW